MPALPPKELVHTAGGRFPSLAASLLKGIWHRHLLRFLLLEGAVFIFGLLCLFLIRTLLTP